MKRTILYPVAFLAELPRHREPKTVIGFAQGDVVIPEIAPSDAPVAIRVSDLDNIFGRVAGTEFGVHQDRLLVDTGIAPDDFGDIETDNLDRRGSLILPSLERLMIEYGLSDPSHIYPNKAMTVVSRLVWSGGIPSDLAEVRSQMVDAGRMAANAQGDIQAGIYKDLATAHAASFAVIAGSVWKQTDEPCYRLTPGRRPGLTTTVADVYSRLRGGLVDSWDRYRTEGRFFSALDRERAYRHGRRVAGLDEYDDADLPRIDLETTDIPLIDFEAHEFERMARLLVYDVADAFRKIAHGRGVEMFLSTPREVMETFIAARDAVSGMDAREGITRHQEDAVQGLIEMLNSSVPRGRPYLVKMTLNEINELFEDWLSREISLEKMVALQMPGAGK